MKKIKVFLCCLMLFMLFFLAGCSVDNIEEIKDDDYIGETVVVSGTVKDSIKLGELSGFTLEDDEGNTIGVASESLPREGEEIVVEGTLKRELVIGYFIDRHE